MNKTNLHKFYVRTVEGHHAFPKDGELDAWEAVLGSYSESQLDAALRRWDRETEVEEYTQKPKGSRMPTPTELKLSMDRFEQSSSKQFTPCGKCDFGWVRVFEGRTAGCEGVHSRVDPKFGAVKRCQCFTDWARQRKAA